jgi:hypothetical protein
MKVTLFFRFFFGACSLMIVWIIVSSNTLAKGIYQANTGGNDISYPQCGTNNYPQNAFDIVGVSDGKAFTDNPCLAEEFAKAKTRPHPTTLYMNLNAPIGPTAHKGMIGPYGHCTRGDMLCQAKNYGYNAARHAFHYATKQGASAPMWWLDIEFANSWSANPLINRGTINGAVKFFTNRHIPVGIYSTPFVWSSITEGYRNNLPVWFATVATVPAPYCSAGYGFTGGVVYMVQYASGGGIDTDYAC